MWGSCVRSPSRTWMWGTPARPARPKTRTARAQTPSPLPVRASSSLAPPLMSERERGVQVCHHRHRQPNYKYEHFSLERRPQPMGCEVLARSRCCHGSAAENKHWYAPHLCPIPGPALSPASNPAPQPRPEPLDGLLPQWWCAQHDARLRPHAQHSGGGGALISLIHLLLLQLRREEAQIG